MLETLLKGMREFTVGIANEHPIVAACGQTGHANFLTIGRSDRRAVGGCIPRNL